MMPEGAPMTIGADRPLPGGGRWPNWAAFQVPVRRRWVALLGAVTVP